MSLSKFFLKKPISVIQQESASNQSLNRTLTAVNITALGIGGIIGAGIFVLTGAAAAKYAGPAIVLSFVFAALACTFAAFCYAEMAAVLPVSGSAYTYAYAALGEFFAWVMGLLLVLEYGVASSTVAVGWSGYVVSLLKDFHIVIPPEWANATGHLVTNADGSSVIGIFNLPAAAIVIGVTTLLMFGIKESARVNNVIVVIKLAVIVIFIGIGMFHVNPENWTPFIPENIGPGQFGYSGILKGAGVIFFAYIGFETISTASQETINPQKNIPIGILSSLFICTILYILVSSVLTGIVPYTALNVPDPMAIAVDAIGLGWLSFLIKIGAIMGLSSVVLVMVYGQTRIFYTVARDGMLPQFFAKIHPKFRTPYLNTIFVGIIVTIGAGITPLHTLSSFVAMGTLFAFIIICGTVLYLRVKEPTLDRPFKCPAVPFIPLAGIVSCSYLIYGIGWGVFIQLKLYFIGGILFYFVYGQFKSKLQQEAKNNRLENVAKN